MHTQHATDEAFICEFHVRLDVYSSLFSLCILGSI